MDEKLAPYEEKMQKSFENMLSEFGTIRAGRANPKILDKVRVSYYGAMTPIVQVANISVPEPRLIQIAPFDPTLLGEIEKAILSSDIGINPSNDGSIIRLVFPELTEERRQDLAKEVKKKGENCKVAIRNIRRDALEHLKKLAKSEDISEDVVKDLEDEAQKLTDSFIKKTDDAVAEKNKEVLTV